MNKYFELPEYTDNMKARVAIFNLKGKSYILREYFKWATDMRTDGFSWSQFKWLFRKKYMLERYYDSNAKEFYELKMG